MMIKELQLISILIPCLNEESYIGNVLDDIVNQDYPKEFLEVFCIDGRSTDSTKKIIAQYIDKYPFIKLLDNPERTVPFALNIGIKKSQGMVMIMGAHASYPKTYISDLFKWMNTLNADNVGCALEAKPPDDSKKSLAISKALSHPFGVGNALFRLGVKEPKLVDTVTFGFYCREVFDRIGYFDEGLIRNQDDEFNARLIKNGGRIFLVPGLKIWYYTRNTFKKLWKMYFQYGYFKPLVAKKVGRPATLRQLIPSLFLCSLFLLFALSSINRVFLYLFIALIILYLIITISVSFQISSKNKITLIPFSILSFFVLHFSYGFGYLRGILDFIILKNRSKMSQKDISISR
jgi:glycosyltransferase involved in cell wall biosynthesis